LDGHAEAVTVGELVEVIVVKIVGAQNGVAQVIEREGGWESRSAARLLR